MSHARFYGEARASWADAVVRYTTEIMPGAVKPATARRYLLSFRQVNDVMRPMHVDEITTRTISAVISARKRQAVTNATIRRDLTAISAVLKACVAWGWRDDNPAKSYDKGIIRERREPIHLPADSDVAEMLTRCAPMVRRVVELLAETGMRQQEAVTLKWAQVNLSRREIQLTHTKTNRPRVVPLNDLAAGTLAGTPRHIKSPLVFWHGDGKPYRNFATNFAKLNRGGKDKRDLGFRCHDLRHRFAVRWLQEGRDIYDLSRVLGHTSVKTTEIYLSFVQRRPERNPEQVQRFVPGCNAENPLQDND